MELTSTGRSYLVHRFKNHGVRKPLVFRNGLGNLPTLFLIGRFLAPFYRNVACLQRFSMEPSTAVR